MSTILKTAEELGITEQQRHNLARLALFVHDKAEDGRFYMSAFFYGSGQASRGPQEGHLTMREGECRTVACLAGHGPAAGIPFEGDETWGGYTRRCFSGRQQVMLRPHEKQHTTPPEDALHTLMFAMLFDSSHRSYRTLEHSPRQQAVRRVAWFLERGLPSPHVNVLLQWEPPDDYTPDLQALEDLVHTSTSP